LALWKRSVRKDLDSEDRGLRDGTIEGTGAGMRLVPDADAVAVGIGIGGTMGVVEDAVDSGGCNACGGWTGCAFTPPKMGAVVVDAPKMPVVVSALVGAVGAEAMGGCCGCGCGCALRRNRGRWFIIKVERELKVGWQQQMVLEAARRVGECAGECAGEFVRECADECADRRVNGADAVDDVVSWPWPSRVVREVLALPPPRRDAI
jgi:hypothetical protein